MTDVTQDPPSSTASVDSTTSSETSFGNTPVRSITPAGTVTVSVRERSGTIIARPHWDSTLAPPTRRAEASGSTSTDNSRPETETEDDGDVDMDRDRADTSPERVGNLPQTSSHTRRAVSIVSFEPNDDFAMGAPPGAPGAIEGTTLSHTDIELSSFNIISSKKHRVL